MYSAVFVVSNAVALIGELVNGSKVFGDGGVILAAFGDDIFCLGGRIFASVLQDFKR